jgi:hypothetical protein
MIWPYILPNCRFFYSYVVVHYMSLVMYMSFVMLSKYMVSWVAVSWYTPSANFIRHFTP